MDQEILYFQFKIYKCIRTPAQWTSHILFLKAMVASTPTYSPDTLFNEVQSKFTNLTNQGLWHTSSKTPEEQSLAMVVQQQEQNKLKATKKDYESKLDNNLSEKKIPPFSNTKGKLGDTKQWNGKTYYYCPTYHKHSHWHTHKVEECNTYKKMQKEKDKKTTNTNNNKSLWILRDSKSVWQHISHPVILTLMTLLLFLSWP